MAIEQKTKQRLIHVVRSNWFLILAIGWAAWLSYSIHSAREDVDALAGQVSVLKDTVDDQDSSEQLEKIEQSLARIERRLP